MKAPPAILAPRKSALGRADLLWLLHTLDKADASEAAGLLGFRYQEPDAEPEDFKPQPPPPPPKPEPKPDPARARAPLRATLFGVVAYRRLPQAPEAPEEEDDAELFESMDGSGALPPPRSALSPPRRLAVFLRQHLRTLQAGRDIDVPRLVAQLQRASLPRHLPRRAALRWGHSSALLIDLSLPAFPLREDLIALAEQAHALSGGHVAVLCFEPGQGWLRRLPGRLPAWAPVTEAALLAAQHWLLAGDLGQHTPEAAARWRRRLAQHLRAGGQASLLMAGNTSNAAALPARQTLWDHGRPLRSTRPRLLPAVDAAAPLLAALSLAVCIEPRLLRAVRLALGLPIASELAAWNHADVAHCVLGMQLRPERLEVYRQHLQALPLPTRERIAALIRAHHEGHSQLIRMEEAALVTALLPESGAMAQTGEAWDRAVHTLLRAPESRAARHLASYLGRTGQRAHEGLWQANPRLADAYVIANRADILTGAALPAGLPGQSLARYLDRAGSTKRDAWPLWLLQAGPALLASSQRPTSGALLRADAPPVSGFELETPAGRRWHPLQHDVEVLATLEPGAGPWTVRTAHEHLTIAEIPRPSWAIEWGRDSEGVYALAPSPLGPPVRLVWSSPEDYRPGWPQRGFSAAPLYIGAAMHLGADLDFGLYVDVEIKGIIQRFRYIEPGEFLMGSSEREVGRDKNEGLQHVVRLTEGYWLADTACSQALWLALIGENPSMFRDDANNPVENVSWDDVQAFLRAVEGLLPGVKAELPTEAEWEYACRAGTTSPFSFGDTITTDMANYKGTPYAGGAQGEFRKTILPVKAFKPNPWGLYQMHGNVWEWCADGWRTYEASAQTDPRGPEGSDDSRALRGGSWLGEARGLRCAFRARGHRAERSGSIGFRFSLRPTSQDKSAERPATQTVSPEGIGPGGVSDGGSVAKPPTQTMAPEGIAPPDILVTVKKAGKKPAAKSSKRKK